MVKWLKKLLIRYTMKSKYTSVIDWESDFKLFRSNPDDKKLLKAILNRITKSEPKLQKQIEIALENNLIDINQSEFFRMTTNKIPKDQILIINTRTNPWFFC